MAKRSRSRRGSKSRSRVSKRTVRRSSKRSRKSRKSGKSRKMNLFFKLMTSARSKGLESFLYKGTKYVKKLGKGGMVFYKKA